MDSLFCHPHDIEAEMAEWEAAHQQQLASARVGAEDSEPSAKSTNSGISELGHAIEESASAVETTLPAMLPIVTTPKGVQPPRREGHGSCIADTPVKRKLGAAFGESWSKPSRRLTEKTKPEHVPQESQVAAQSNQQAKFNADDLMKLVQIHTKFEYCRDYFFQVSRPEYRKHMPHATSSELTCAMRAAWRQMTEQERNLFIQDRLHAEFGCCSKVPPEKLVLNYAVDYVRQQEIQMQEACKINPKAPGRHRGCLYTWNGMMMEGSKDVDSLVEQFDDLSDLEAALRNSETFRDLVVEYQSFVDKRMKDLSFKHFSWVVELSLHSQDKGRVHFHLYISDEERRFVGTQSAWKFRGFRPDLRPSWHKGRASDAAINQGHYYCQCNKEGTLYQQSNYLKLQHFAVDQRWVIALWKVRKLSTETAVREVKQARGTTITYLRELNKIDEIDEEQFIREEQVRILALIEANRSPFRLILDVALWQRQYLEFTEGGIWGKDSRFKFLVLTGPSSFGKTQYAKSLFGSNNTLVVNCQNALEPNLKPFSRRHHKAIIFDECSCSTILFSKVTFQASVEGTMLAQSQCNEHSYWRFLYGIPMIVCCNDWLRGVKDAADFEWLATNSIVYNVARPTWSSKDEDLLGVIES